MKLSKGTRTVIHSAVAVCTAIILGSCGVESGAPAPSRTADGHFTVTTVASGFVSPWGLTFLREGGALVSERDTGAIDRVSSSGEVVSLGVVPGVVSDGEGGLLGIELSPDQRALYAYLTTAEDNRVVRMTWNGNSLGDAVPVVTGIPKAGIHNGGRIAFGPDGMLYIATGDAGDTTNAQRLDSLGGKVLRVTPDGEPAPSNPWKDSLVWSLGHRNVQGLAFDSDGTLWASEFGASTADELNRIVPGGDYGWPQVEGRGNSSQYIDPVTTWEPTSLASPSGIAVLGSTVYVASLRGEVLWEVPIAAPQSPVAAQLGDLGRLRTIEVAPDGSLWLMTSNTDGRGEPRDGDDRILRLMPQ